MSISGGHLEQNPSEGRAGSALSLYYHNHLIAICYHTNVAHLLETNPVGKVPLAMRLSIGL
jgi:hypothetical protein